jgi:hypothetical protein
MNKLKERKNIIKIIKIKIIDKALKFDKSMKEFNYICINT